MLSHEEVRGGLQQGGIQRRLHRPGPLGGGGEGGGGTFDHEVAIATPRRRESGVEIVGDRRDGADLHDAAELTVQLATKFLGVIPRLIQRRGQIHVSHLADGVHPTIGTTRPHDEGAIAEVK